MRICAIESCSNSTYTLEVWHAKLCSIHMREHDDSNCNCPPPFVLYPFPTEKKSRTHEKFGLNLFIDEMKLPNQIGYQKVL